MKKCLAIVLAGVCFNLACGQTLYTENFNNYPVGNFGTDYTGVIPAQGGWYTLDGNFLAADNADYQIVAETGRGNTLYLGYTNRALQNLHSVFRNDVNTYWQQRNTNNNVFKISFDIFTQEANDSWGSFFIENKLIERLLGITYHGQYKYLQVSGKTLGDGRLKYSNGSLIVLPVNTWVTIEAYVDYNNSNLYISIPTMNNYTTVFKMSTLQLGGTDTEGNPLPDDSPVKIAFNGRSGVDTGDPKKDNPFRLRIDNINISAQNTVPTVNLNLNEHLSSQFNLYPNPATNVVNITNNENMLVQQVTVYDILGKQLNTQTFNNQAEIQLNVENLSNGTYMLHIQTNEGMAVKKLVKK